MSHALACPICTMTDILVSPEKHECVICGHEWPREPAVDDASPPIVKDSNGNVLHPADSVTLIKDLKVKGSSKTLKAGTKVKGIRLVDGAQHAGHDIDATADGMGVMLKSQFVKKA